MQIHNECCWLACKTLLLLWQVAKTIPGARGLLIGSYCNSGPLASDAADARTVRNSSRQPIHAGGPLALPTLSPLSSRPSTVSANHRYAPTLATEASTSSSEPESAAESAAGSAAGLAWGESGEERAAACTAGSTSSTRGFGAVPAHAEGSDATCQPKVTVRLAAGKAHAVWKKAGLQRCQADSAFATAHAHHGAKLRTHLHAEHSFKPPSTPAAAKSAHASAHPSKQHAMLPLGQEEFRLLESLQRLDCQLSLAHKGSSRGEAPQHAQRSSLSRVPSPAQHSRLLASAPSQQKPPQSQRAAHANEASPPLSTQAIPTGPGAKVASSRLPRRASRWPTAQADSPIIPPSSTTAGSTVSGGHARFRGGRRAAAAAKLQGGRRAGAGMLSKTAAVGGSEADASNSAEQQALQQSLAKLDARLTSLTARCAGRLWLP